MVSPWTLKSPPGSAQPRKARLLCHRLAFRGMGPGGMLGAEARRLTAGSSARCPLWPGCALRRGRQGLFSCCHRQPGKAVSRA